jgi:FMN phosphatase YigB (HAD superfamily)
MREVELIDHGIDLNKFFPTCRFSAADFGYLKPHPSIFQAALDCLNARPAEMVYVGDNLLADVNGAKGVGSFAVLRNSRPDQEEPDDPVPPDATIETLHDLPAVLDAAFPGWRN